MLTRYQKRLSGPFVDRIDTLRDIEGPSVEYEKLTDDRLSESSAVIRARVVAAHERPADVARLSPSS